MIGLTLLVLTIVFTSLFYSGRTTARTRAGIVMKSDLMMQFHQIRFQLLNLYKQKNGETLIGVEGTRARKGEVYFLTTSLKQRKGVGEVGYKIITDYDGTDYLAYTEFPYPRERRFAFNNSQDKWKPVSRLIQGLTVEYELNRQWKKSWKYDDAPSRIKVTFWYSQDENDKTLTPFSFIVVPGIKSIF
ncbi:MAG: hypothetical protein K8T10_12435 [Candidatus Eremiobacteraeota bacterium]|nr:hypothetical protein [Candidatus Eremiobacteraeota bacterium]